MRRRPLSWAVRAMGTSFSTATNAVSAAMTVKFITLKSARGHSYEACELALAQLASKRFPLEKVTTHRFGLKDVDLAIKSVGGKGVPDVIHASLMPWT